MNGLVLVWCFTAVLMGCTPAPSPSDKVEAWYFDTQAGTVFGTPRVQYPFHTTGPFESETECNRGIAYFMDDRNLMIQMQGEVFSKCYPKWTTKEDMEFHSMRAP